MGKRLGRFAVTLTWMAVCAAALFVLPILFGATAIQAALISAITVGALAAAWVSEFMYRKAFPNLFQAFEQDRPDRRPVGEGDE